MKVLSATLGILFAMFLLTQPVWAHRGTAHKEVVAPAAATAVTGIAGAASVSPQAAVTTQKIYPGLYFDIWFDGRLFFILVLALAIWVATVQWQAKKNKAVFPAKSLGFFVAGLVAFYLAAATSLDEIGETYLFSAHMVQHCVLIYIVGLLLILGMPKELLEPLLVNKLMRRFTHFMTAPLVAFAAFNIDYAIWHYPSLYEWALRDRLIHDIEHFSFLGFGILMWWPIVDPLPQHFPGLRHAGMKMLYIFLNAVAQMPLFAWLSLTRDVRYPTYRLAERIIPVSAIEDQIIGGIIMKIAAMVVFIIVWAIIFYRWYDRELAAAASPKVDPALEERRHA